MFENKHPSDGTNEGVGEDQLDAILKDPKTKVALLKKMRLDTEEQGDSKRPIPRRMNMQPVHLCCFGQVITRPSRWDKVVHAQPVPT